MDSATTVAQGIHATDGKSAYDRACKRLLSQKIILAWILQSCVEEFRDLDVNDIAEKYIEGTPTVGQEPVFPDEKGPLIQGMNTEDSSPLEGTVTYDIKFRAIAPVSGELIELYVNVEAQGKHDPGYPLLKRGIFYCSRMISSQANRDFTDSHYEKIKKVYSIWVCLNVPEDRKNTITRYQMTEESLVGDVKEPIADYDLLSVIMIRLGGPETEHYDGILKLLHTLLSNKTSEAEKREVLENEFSIQMTHETESEVLSMCNLSQVVKEEGLQEGLQKGLLKGRQEGRQEGLQEGRQEERLLLLKNLMKNMKMPLEQALAALEIPERDRQEYRRLLAEQ